MKGRSESRSRCQIRLRRHLALGGRFRQERWSCSVLRWKRQVGKILREGEVLLNKGRWALRDLDGKFVLRSHESKA